MTFSARNLTPRIGVEIKSDAATLLSAAHAKEIRELLEQRGAIIFPRIHLSDEEQVAFAHTLGGVIEQGERAFSKFRSTPRNR